MAVLTRLDWLERQAKGGTKITIHFSGNALQEKIRFIVDKAHPGGGKVSNMAISAVQLVRSAIDRHVVVDRGHQHSNGWSEVSFWLKPMAATDAGEEARGQADAHAAHQLGGGVLDDSANSAMLGTLSNILSHVSYSSEAIAEVNLNVKSTAQMVASVGDGQVQFVNALWMLSTKLSELYDSVATLVGAVGRKTEEDKIEANREAFVGGDMVPPYTAQIKRESGIASAS
jgi:hypothetical protein